MGVYQVDVRIYGMTVQISVLSPDQGPVPECVDVVGPRAVAVAEQFPAAVMAEHGVGHGDFYLSGIPLGDIDQHLAVFEKLHVVYVVRHRIGVDVFEAAAVVEHI